MAFTVKVWKRDFSAPMNLDGLDLRVRSYAMSEEGGPVQAEIEVIGGREDLWELVELLRCPVEVMDEEGDVVWWGYLSRVEIHDGVMVDAVSLDEMFNRLAEAYTLSIPGVSTPGDRFTTPWVQDNDSVTQYGTKEILLSLPQATDAEAENVRDYELAQRKYPVPVTTIGNGVTDPPFGKIFCRGWWETLSWVSYTRSAGLEQNANTQGDHDLGGPGATVGSYEATDGTQTLGAVAGATKVEGSFILTQGWHVTQLALKIRTEGSPADNVLLKLYSDAAGVPSVLLGTATLAATALSDALNWATWTLASAVPLAAGTPYHVEISRSGAVDAVNYYVISVDEALGYVDGALQLWNGAAWVARSPDADLVFRLLAPAFRLETSFQLTGGEAWTASNVQIYVHAEGTPADNLRVRLYTDSAGAPGTLLATGTFLGTSVPTGAAWLTLTLDTEVALSLATTYHLQVDRTGSPDADHYYVIGVDEGLSYTAGTLKLYTGSTWLARDWETVTPDADLAFVIGGVEETTTQIETALADAEFITDVDIEDDSGIFTSQYRDGDQRLLDVVRDLLAAGITGGGRLLATVTKDRIVRLYAAPVKENYAYLINRRGELATATGGPVDLQKCPVAEWVRREDIPGEANTERLVDLSKFYIEAAEFNVQNGYTPTPRGASRPFELPGQIRIA
jgi:hypothetical protein